jgi:hypothetical protein
VHGSRRSPRAPVREEPEPGRKIVARRSRHSHRKHATVGTRESSWSFWVRTPPRDVRDVSRRGNAQLRMRLAHALAHALRAHPSKVPCLQRRGRSRRLLAGSGRHELDSSDPRPAAPRGVAVVRPSTPSRENWRHRVGPRHRRLSPRRRARPR